jgi:agmatinase
MTVPRYEYTASLVFGGTKQDECAYERAQAVLLPVPLERTTSYVAGTRNGPREILLASGQMELWDEETSASAGKLATYTLPEMELPFGTLEGALDEIRRVAGEVLDADKFLIALGGEHSVTIPLVEAATAQLDAHADLREAYMGNRFSHASVMRRVVERARCTQVAIRSVSEEESRAVPSLPTTMFYDVHMRKDADWMDRVVDSLGDPVYLTIDCDGFDPAIMPAVGTPEPGGLGWYEGLTLLRKVFAARRVVACDLVELSPLPGMVAPNFLCARLIYKILTYRRLAGETADR